MIEKLCKDILKKSLNPKRIYKSKGKNYFSIEIHYINPISYESLLYSNEKERDDDFTILEDKTFGSLSFNPYVNKEL